MLFGFHDADCMSLDNSHLMRCCCSLPENLYSRSHPIVQVALISFVLHPNFRTWFALIRNPRQVISRNREFFRKIIQANQKSIYIFCLSRMQQFPTFAVLVKFVLLLPGLSVKIEIPWDANWVFSVAWDATVKIKNPVVIPWGTFNSRLIELQLAICSLLFGLHKQNCNKEF